MSWLIETEGRRVRRFALAVLAIVWSTMMTPAHGQIQPAMTASEVVLRVPAEYRHRLIQQLSIADDRAGPLISMLQNAPADKCEAFAFLIEAMPPADFKTITAATLQKDVDQAFEMRKQSTWGPQVPNEIFLNNVLPYCNLTETRDPWREMLAQRCWPMVKDCKSVREAVGVLNRELFKQLHVSYHATRRLKPDQSPAESMQIGYASCTGLSIILVDACRSVGIPARVAGTPMWFDDSGNHTWVEVWDGQWWFVGAAEPGEFNHTWFVDSAAKADPAAPQHRIYASSFLRTDTLFPLEWAPDQKDCCAMDVTAYYRARRMLHVNLTDDAGKPVAGTISVYSGSMLIAQATGTAATFELGSDADYKVTAAIENRPLTAQQIRLDSKQDLTLSLGRQSPVPLVIIPELKELEGDWAAMRTIIPRAYLCKPTTRPIQIDGRGSDRAWAAADWSDDFVDIEGDRRPKPRFRTRVKMLWDHSNLYVLAEMQEPHVWATITEKNQVIFKDNDFEIFLNPDGDHHNYYEFEINALNTIWELNLAKPYRNDGEVRSPSNISGLRSAVHVDGTLNQPGDTDRGWSVEVAIPWQGLQRFADSTACPPRDGDRWRINFSRVEWLVDIIDGNYRKIPKEMRDEDNWVWSPQGVIDMHRPERWGFLQFATNPDASAATPSPDLAQRDQLMQLYYRQDQYKKRTGHYATAPSALNLDPDQIKIESVADGYRASVALPDDAGSPRRLYVSDDSRIWMQR